MRSINDTPAASRFLMVSHRLSVQAWRSECDAVTKWLAGMPETVTEAERDQMLTTIQQPLCETEHPFVIVFCYADIPKNTTWDVAFDRKTPDRHEFTTATLQFGVICHRVVSPSLTHGWHQVAVIDFPKGMPRLIESLPVDPQTEQSSYRCLCAASDFPTIQCHEAPVT